MSAAIDAVLYGFLYALVGVLFTKAYKIFFPDSYNFLNWSWNDPDADGPKEYDKNKKYKETGYWFAIFVFPAIALWLAISRPVILFNKLIRLWFDIKEDQQ